MNDWSPEGITETIDIRDVRKYRGKWNSRKEYETVKVVRDRFVRMQLGRRTGCPWASLTLDTTNPNITGSSNDGVSTGSDWVSRWNNDLKLWSMWHEYLDNRSNLKSPISYAPVEAAVAEFQDNELRATLTPTQEIDQEKATIYERILDHLHYVGDFNKTNAENFKRELIFGTAITYTGWVKKVREVELIMTSLEAEKQIKDKKTRDEAKKRLQEEGKPLTKKTEIIEYDDVAIIPVSIYEFFVDPTARVMRGPAYEAMDCIWRTIPSLEQFRAEFKNSGDPWVIKENIDKVYPAYVAERMYTEGIPFFKAPRDISMKNQVELVRYYNKQTDKYIIIANDVLVREGPLPYNHKELPFAIHKFVEFPDMFYGVGLPTVLESLQAEDETLRNMMLDQLKLTLTPPIFINSQVFGEVDQQWERVEPGLKISVDGPVGNDSIRWFESSQTRLDYFQMRNTIREDAVQASGINPLMYAMPRAGEAVRNNMITLESSLKQIKKGIKNWSAGYKEVIKQIIALIKQFYPDAYVEEFNPDLKKRIKKYKSIITRGEKMYEDQNGQLQSEKIPGNAEFELKEEYLDLSGSLEVEIDIDTLMPISRSVKMQKNEAAFAQLVPVLSNPMMLNAPGVIELVRDYIKTHGLPTNVADDLREANSEAEVRRAIDQETIMFQGMPVEGVPGESNVHKLEHTQAIMGLIMKGSADPQAKMALDPIIRILSEHLAQDDMSKTAGGGGSIPTAPGAGLPMGAQQGNPQMNQGQMAANPMGESGPVPMGM